MKNLYTKLFKNIIGKDLCEQLFRISDKQRGAFY